MAAPTAEAQQQKTPAEAVTVGQVQANRPVINQPPQRPTLNQAMTGAQPVQGKYDPKVAMELLKRGGM